MAITAFGSSAYVQCPAGLHHAVCVDIVDLGIEVSDKFTDKDGKPTSAHKIRIVWQIEEEMSDGRRFSIGRKFTLSLNDKSKLRPFLESWRGVPFSEKDLAQGFDIEKLIGVNCTLQLMKSEDGKYTNVANVMPPTKGAELLEPLNYTRVKDRAEQPSAPGFDEAFTGTKSAPKAKAAKAGAVTEDDDDEIPF